MEFDCATSASRGSRSYQEDSAALWPQPGTAIGAGDAALSLTGQLLAVLADGMGGHAGGALASQIVCRSFIDAFSRAGEPIRDRLRIAMLAANVAIDAATRDQPHLAGMGSTLIGAWFGPEGLHWVSVGDSPLYIYRRGEIALVNEDHSLAPALDRMAADGRITHEQARNDPRRHMLRSAICGQEIEMVDLCRKPLALEPDDYIVLASDGIHAIDEQLIARVITAWAHDGPAAVAEALIRAVDSVRDPNQDNSTVVAVRARGPA